MSTENAIAKRMQALGITADALSVLANIPPSRLSQAFRQIKPLGAFQSQHILKLLTSLEELAELTKPLPIDWKNPSAIREVLDKLDAGKLTIQINGTPIAVDGFLVNGR